MFEEADVEEVVDLVERDVQLLKLLEGLDALHFFQLASSDVQHAHVLERGADVSETADDRVIKLQVLKTRQDFSGHLQVVAGRVHS